MIAYQEEATSQNMGMGPMIILKGLLAVVFLFLFAICFILNRKVIRSIRGQSAMSILRTLTTSKEYYLFMLFAVLLFIDAVIISLISN